MKQKRERERDARRNDVMANEWIHTYTKKKTKWGRKKETEIIKKYKTENHCRSNFTWMDLCRHTIDQRTRIDIYYNVRFREISFMALRQSVQQPSLRECHRRPLHSNRAILTNSVGKLNFFHLRNYFAFSNLRSNENATYDFHSRASSMSRVLVSPTKKLIQPKTTTIEAFYTRLLNSR